MFRIMILLMVLMSLVGTKLNSDWLDFSNFKIFVEFSADELGLNCGFDF